MILHYFSSNGWQEWDVQGQPLVERLKSEVMGLRDRLSRASAVTAELEAFRHTALSRLAVQHEEITALRRDRAPIRASPLRPGDG